MTHDRPGVFVELHAHEHVAGDPDAGDHLALTVLDLDDVLHGDLDLVDVLFHLERVLALLDVRLHLALEAGVGVDDVPLARQRPQLGAERLVGVFRLGRLGLRLDLGGVDDLGGRGHFGDGILVEHGLVGLAVDVGTVVRGHVVGGRSGGFGLFFGERVGEHLSGGLGLGGLVNLECVVHDGVCLRVVDVDVFVVVLAVVVFVVVDDVHGEVLGGSRGSLFGGEDVALLGFVVLTGLLGGGGPVGVVDILFRHVCSLPSGAGWRSGARVRREHRRRR